MNPVTTYTTEGLLSIYKNYQPTYDDNNKMYKKLQKIFTANRKNAKNLPSFKMLEKAKHSANETAAASASSASATSAAAVALTTGASGSAQSSAGLVPTPSAKVLEPSHPQKEQNLTGLATTASSKKSFYELETKTRNHTLSQIENFIQQSQTQKTSIFIEHIIDKKIEGSTEKATIIYDLTKGVVKSRNDNNKRIKAELANAGRVNLHGGLGRQHSYGGHTSMHGSMAGSSHGSLRPNRSATSLKDSEHGHGGHFYPRRHQRHDRRRSGHDLTKSMSNMSLHSSVKSPPYSPPLIGHNPEPHPIDFYPPPYMGYHPMPYPGGPFHDGYAAAPYHGVYGPAMPAYPPETVAPVASADPTVTMAEENKENVEVKPAENGPGEKVNAVKNAPKKYVKKPLNPNAASYQKKNFNPNAAEFKPKRKVLGVKN